MDQQLEKAEIVKIEYEQPKLVHRVLANFLDILLMVGMTIVLFIASRAIVQSTPMYHHNDLEIRKVELASGLYNTEGYGPLLENTMLKVEDWWE